MSCPDGLVQRSRRLFAACCMVLLAGCATQPVSTAAQYPAPAPYYAPGDLDTLVAQIALYPDDLIAIILPASTRPLQIVQAERFLAARAADPGLQPDPAWDDSVIALLNYPTVLTMLSQDLDWTAALGAAVAEQPDAVMDAVQRFRHEVYAAGNLRSDQHQIVYVNGGLIEIRPADPEVIYVPYYEPAQVVVYDRWPAYSWSTIGYPVYYYPYPAQYQFYDDGPFWGLSTFFSINWSNHRFDSYYHDHDRHPYRGRRYERDWREGRDWQRSGRQSYAAPGRPSREAQSDRPLRRYEAIPSQRPQTVPSWQQDRSGDRGWTGRDGRDGDRDRAGSGDRDPNVEQARPDDAQIETPNEGDSSASRRRGERQIGERQPYLRGEQANRTPRPYGESRTGGNWLDRQPPPGQSPGRERRNATAGGAAPGRLYSPPGQNSAGEGLYSPPERRREGRAAQVPGSGQRRSREDRSGGNPSASVAEQAPAEQASGESQAQSQRVVRGRVMAAPPPEVQAPRERRGARGLAPPDGD